MGADLALLDVGHQAAEAGVEVRQEPVAVRAPLPNPRRDHVEVAALVDVQQRRSQIHHEARVLAPGRVLAALAVLLRQLQPGLVRDLRQLVGAAARLPRAAFVDRRPQPFAPRREAVAVRLVRDVEVGAQHLVVRPRGPREQRVRARLEGVQPMAPVHLRAQLILARPQRRLGRSDPDLAAGQQRADDREAGELPDEQAERHGARHRRHQQPPHVDRRQPHARCPGSSCAARDKEPVSIQELI